MPQVIITINNREYPVACGEGQEMRILQLAKIVDEKATSLGAGANQVSESMLLAMTSLLLADELSEVRQQGSFNANNTPTQKINFEALDKEISERIRSIL
ncbi:MAG: cell division protein ZapA [Alphaproteobacteria bacterium]